MLDYPALAAVSAIVREGTFERAATKLGITSSAISQRVKALEERLGTVLIVRGQPCRATETGRSLVAHFDRVEMLETELRPALNLGGLELSKPLTIKIAVNADSLATWFPDALVEFAKTGILLDLVLEDEAHTSDRLRAGEVLAAVTSETESVQGCKTVALGSLVYVACASPGYVERYFPNGVNAKSLRDAPYTRFDRRDFLQGRWAKEAVGAELTAPTHWVPSTGGFMDFARAGIAWGLQPLTLAKPMIESGQLVELVEGTPIKVKLYWTIARLHGPSLQNLTQAVSRAAKIHLK